MTPLEIAAQLRTIRQEKGLTLRQVAQLAALPMSTIAHAELSTVDSTPWHRRSVPRASTLECWAAALGRKVELVLTVVDVPSVAAPAPAEAVSATDRPLCESSPG